MKKVIIALTIFSMCLTAYVTYELFAWDKLFVFNPKIMGWYFSLVIGFLWIYFLFQLARAKEKKDFHLLSTILKILIVAGLLSMELLNNI